MPKKIVITGGPGTGKTSLINHLDSKGYNCMHEISRDVILKAQEEGIDQLFLEDPILFSKKLLEGRLVQFEEGNTCKNNILFYDRGLPDITAYMDYLGTNYPDYFNDECLGKKYHKVFILPPWEDIYLQDNERYETFIEAKNIY
jgi:predicted ATPase